MKFKYYPETDSLYIVLSDRVSVDSVEAAPGVVLDFDEKGKLIGIDIDHASRVIEDISSLEIEELPINKLLMAGPSIPRRLKRVHG